MSNTENLIEDDVNILELSDYVKKVFEIKDVDIRTYNPLSLAFIGDCVYEIIVRTIIIDKGNKSVNALAKDKNSLVNAKTQSMIADFLTDYYTEEESEVYRRGKNAKTANHSKSAAFSEYHKATGLEALFGYLYLTGRTKRCVELFKIWYDSVEAGNGN